MSLQARCRAAALVVAALAVSTGAHAGNCSALRSQIEDSRDYLRRATRETDLDSAQTYARRAYNSLSESASSAYDCDCLSARSDLDSAATYARRASREDDPDDFPDMLNRAIRAFNNALGSLRSCR